ncbi:hypothetical protein ATCC90586_012194 [Pythium insidiosum]|nr:hypothetical protein ATCC90586_012194 [Pythium insidiosum]
MDVTNPPGLSTDDAPTSPIKSVLSTFAEAKPTTSIVSPLYTSNARVGSPTALSVDETKPDVSTAFERSGWAYI